MQGERFGTFKAIRVAGELVDAVGPGESAWTGFFVPDKFYELSEARSRLYGHLR